VWNSSNDISIDAALFIFKENYKYEPLVEKLSQVKQLITSISELMDIAGRFAKSDKRKAIKLVTQIKGSPRKRATPHRS
jgi:hypothetical protein